MHSLWRRGNSFPHFYAPNSHSHPLISLRSIITSKFYFFLTSNPLSIPSNFAPSFKSLLFRQPPSPVGCPHDLHIHSVAHIKVIPEPLKFFEPLIFFTPTLGTLDYLRPQFNYGISPVHILWGTHLGSTNPTFKNSPFSYRLTLLWVSTMRTS